MNIAIIGSGGREHSLCVSLNNSKKVKKIFCIPGNAGTDAIAKNIKLKIDNFKFSGWYIKFFAKIFCIYF